MTAKIKIIPNSLLIPIKGKGMRHSWKLVRTNMHSSSLDELMKAISASQYHPLTTKDELVLSNKAVELTLFHLLWCCTCVMLGLSVMVTRRQTVDWCHRVVCSLLSNVPKSPAYRTVDWFQEWEIIYRYSTSWVSLQLDLTSAKQSHILSCFCGLWRYIWELCEKSGWDEFHRRNWLKITPGKRGFFPYTEYWTTDQTVLMYIKNCSSVP